MVNKVVVRAKGKHNVELTEILDIFKCVTWENEQRKEHTKNRDME